MASLDTIADLKRELERKYKFRYESVNNVKDIDVFFRRKVHHVLVSLGIIGLMIIGFLLVLFMSGVGILILLCSIILFFSYVEYTNFIISKARKIWNKIKHLEEERKFALQQEEMLDYKGAIAAYERIQDFEEAKRLRIKMREEGKVRVAQKVVHGDEIVKTSIRDSVVSRSSIAGASGGEVDIASKLRELAQLRDEGILTDTQFETAKNKLLDS